MVISVLLASNNMVLSKETCKQENKVPDFFYCWVFFCSLPRHTDSSAVLWAISQKLAVVLSCY